MPEARVGTLILVVGPSGVGKDSLIDGLRARLDPRRFEFARRVITRPADAGGETHEACDAAAFEQLEAAGGFLVSWRAHGLAYGLPASLTGVLRAGRHVIANASRSVVASLRGQVDALAVLEVDAPPQVIAERLRARGRETAQDIASRIARPRVDYPDGVAVLRVVNDATVEIGVTRAEALLRAHLQELGSQDRAGVVSAHRKVAGARLAPQEWAEVLSSVVERRLDDPLRDAFLAACAQDLDDDELLAVARWRCGLMPRVDWGSPLVVDKHSLGGTAGSRVTMVVIPIVAAHGLVIPKTSSRAITSAAGTADAMEVLARVDLTPQELRDCVARARGCIAWNGRLNHSALDESMHRLERALRLPTHRWSAASILSKKHSAGATHVVIDIPYAPAGKVASLAQAQAMAQCFESLGARLGLTVRAHPTDGSAPIGRGIGPALEVRDVLQVLDGDPAAPPDLRRKSLFFASRILAFDPALGGDEDRAQVLAQRLLDSGAARAALEAIVEAQGRRPPPDASGLRHREVTAATKGVVTAIRAPAVNAVARAAGAPADVWAGVDLLVAVGDRVEAGQPVYRIQARDAVLLEAAGSQASRDAGVDVRA